VVNVAVAVLTTEGSTENILAGEEPAGSDVLSCVADVIVEVVIIEDSTVDIIAGEELAKGDVST
jgi:hypothetical protein